MLLATCFVILNMNITEPKIIDGKAISQDILFELHKRVAKKKLKVGLAAILIGDDPSSHLYVRLKKQACEKCDIQFNQYLFGGHPKTEEVIETIRFLNADEEVTGILVQLPLPAGLDTDAIIAAIDPAKDVDGFHPENVKKIEMCQAKIISPLVLGIVELIKATGEIIKDKKIAILCNHKIFGKPFSCFYGADNEINVITLEDENYLEVVKNADVLIVSIGKANFIKEDMIKQDAIVIDVGINQLDDGIVGDVDFQDVLPKVKFITPVPGGVGPMTVAMLLQNLLNLQK